MEHEVINTQKGGERVTSTYADTYFDDYYCDYKQSNPDSDANVQTKPKTLFEGTGADWVSPSDLLIGIVDLKPPFTSKITRAKTHEGILAIGNDILVDERAKFMKYLTNLIYENDSAWNHILQFEKAAVVKQVKDIYEKIFVDKSKVMKNEIALFFEKTLYEIERNIKVQVDNVLISTHASIVSKLNTDIKEKLKIEKNILEKILDKRYQSEVAKLKKYYKLLFNNEKLRSTQLINRTIVERNDAIKAFIRQIEAENTSSTMYVMCTERKKCKIKQFILENYQSHELKEKYQKLKERQDVIDMFKDQETHLSQINSEWEEKIKKILQLFLKFISFSLKLLPEQSSFLINFEKLVVLQLNDMQKMPHKNSSVLIDAEKLNDFKFETMEEEKKECTKEPFVITGGHLSGTPSTQYGSRETIPDDVDLPAIRLQRQFVYAKCHNYEEIKAKLEAERCKCMDYPTAKPLSKPETSTYASVSKPNMKQKLMEQRSETSISNSFEDLLIDHIHRRDECPDRNCQKWFDSSSFPYLNAYLDFDDEKYERVVTILGKNYIKGTTPLFVDPKEIINRELPFATTKEPYRNVETQYSSQEDLYIPDLKCPCFKDHIPQNLPSNYKIQESPSKILAENMTKRKTSLRRLLQENPKLMKILTDESFDFKY